MLCDRRTPNRRAPTLAQRINPLWLAGDVERPQAWPALAWFLRNPFANMLSTVLGVAHLSRSVWYSRSPWTFAGQGTNYGWTWADGVPIPLPFVSYRGRYLESCSGWMTSGNLTILTFRRSNSPNARPTP